MNREQKIDILDVPRPRIFSSAEDLIRACGCVVHYTYSWDKLNFKKVDVESDDCAQLYEGGNIGFNVAAYNEDPVKSLPYACHEAIHHFLGEDSLEDEAFQMPFEIELYRSIKNTEERRSCLAFMLDFETHYSTLEKAIRLFGSRWPMTLGFELCYDESFERKLLTKKHRLTKKVIRQLRKNL